MQSLNVDAIIRGGLTRFTDQLGKLWCSLADYYIRSGHFEKVRGYTGCGTESSTKAWYSGHMWTWREQETPAGVSVPECTHEHLMQIFILLKAYWQVHSLWSQPDLGSPWLCGLGSPKPQFEKLN